MTVSGKVQTLFYFFGNDIILQDLMLSSQPPHSILMLVEKISRAVSAQRYRSHSSAVGTTRPMKSPPSPSSCLHQSVRMLREKMSLSTPTSPLSPPSGPAPPIWTERQKSARESCGVVPPAFSTCTRRPIFIIFKKEEKETAAETAGNAPTEGG